ncbi:MAG TPA: YsnF/AvaK domain-containing protein [Xenococcaceae cyanobacterium]
MNNSNLSNQSRDLNSQLANLGKQLISYRVLDRQGRIQATVQDIYYGADKSFNLLIQLEGKNNQSILHQLDYSDVYQIDTAKHLVLSNLSPQQIANLPIYQPVPDHFKSTLKDAVSDQSNVNSVLNQNHEPTQVLEVQQIPLLEEKLRVARHKHKIGEVIVRKQVETRMIQVPVRREKLIVERVGKNPERLSEVVIGSEKVNGFEYEALKNTDSLHMTKSQFLDLQTAQQLLEALGQLNSATNAKVRLEIVTDCLEAQTQHQHLCDRYH